MRRIQRLPAAIYSSVRSGIVICDFARIVEELIFNSLEAGATKVSVAVAVSSCYIKVADNGSGITRDGLVLLGERYATSKVDHLATMDATGSFRFQGEALGSISDISLLEIVTKARGKPNGYRKVMKGCKCLYLGINDERRDVGTTVTVRDIFYNQPVRRKNVQSSPKKVLDSIKECVLRTALVHLDVTFKVNDIDSEDEVLCVGPSPSPLPILLNNFRIEVSSSLNDMSVSEGVLKLSGCISGPCDIFYPKAIQYVYINSRYICKGPIHKLLNQLAARFNSSSWKPSNGLQKRKRNSGQLCPLFILNLNCPTSHYDIITFERSKSSAEFKDWAPVLTFIESAVTRLWEETLSNEKDWTGACQSGRTFISGNCRTSFEFPSEKLRTLSENCDSMPTWEEYTYSPGKLHKNGTAVKSTRREAGFLCHGDYVSPSCDESLVDCGLNVKKESSTCQSPCNVPSVEHQDLVTDKSDKQLSGTFWSGWEDMSPKIDAKMNADSTGNALSDDCLELSNDANLNKDLGRSFLKSCFFQRRMLNDRTSLVRHEVSKVGSDDFKFQEKFIEGDDRVVDEIDQVFYAKNLQHDRSSLLQSSSGTQGSDFLSRDLGNPYLIARKNLDDEKYNLQDKFRPDWEYGSCHHLISPGCSPMTSGPIARTRFTDDDFTDTSIHETHFKFCKDGRHEYSTQAEGEDYTINVNDIEENVHLKEEYSMNSSPHLKGCADHRRENGGFYEFHLDDSYSPGPFKGFRETDWSLLPPWDEESPTDFSVPSLQHMLPADHMHGKPHRSSRKTQSASTNKKSSGRSYSAPPFYQGKKRFLSLSDSSIIVSEKMNSQTSCSSFFLPESRNQNQVPESSESSSLKYSLTSFGQHHRSSILSSGVDSFLAKRQCLKRTPENTDFKDCKPEKKDQQTTNSSLKSVKFLASEEMLDSPDSGRKWRNDSINIMGGGLSDNYKDQDSVLDVFSGILHLAGDSLVPKSIDKSSLEGAKVLNQVDKKFIAIVARRTLAIIDQHAADERIRLEELRSKVLCGEMKTITYLDAEQTLVLPESGYQLLQNYAEQIQNWGWICNIFSQDSRNLNLLHRQPTVAKLIAVPCILGVDLTDVDLLEYLQQLADTDGSSTIPPAVNRILNNKACRGAIMFGDSLLPTECSLIVEELNRTALCFQCAHGRPTTAPLVDLDILHNLIAKLGSWNAGLHNSWHGLRKHGLSLERAAKRLNLSPG